MDVLMMSYVTLVLAVIVFSTDIVWQYWVAVKIGPRIARGLILESVEFRRLENFVERLNESKVDVEKLQSHSQAWFEFLQKKLIEIGDLQAGLVQASNENLYQRISGLMGYQIKESLNRDVDLSEISTDLGEDDEPIDLLDPKVARQLEQFEKHYDRLCLIMDEDAAEKAALAYMDAPGWFKSPIKKAIRKRVEGLLPE